MAAPSLPPLVQVQTTLCHTAPRLATLPHVADLITAFLDKSLLASLVQAASSGSLSLFRRVVTRWSNASLDTVDREYSLTKALEAAIRTDSLAIVEAIHALHPEPLDAQSLKFAMAHGSFELVQWVVANRRDRVCCQTGIGELCIGCVEMAAKWIGDKDTFRIASWLIDNDVMAVSDGSESNRRLEMQLLVSGGLTEAAHAALLRSAELVRWCDKRGLLTDRMIAKLVRDTLRDANGASFEIVQYFLQRGYKPEREDELVDDVIAASCQRDQDALVEYVLASDVFSNVRDHFVYAPTQSSGDTKVLQWDLSYEDQRKARNFLGMSRATASAGTHGHLATMQWLVTERNVTTLKAPLSGVSEEESLEIIQWLPATERDRWGPSIIDSAAAYGRLKVVRWLHENRPGWCSEQAMDDASGNGHLEVVQWLHTNRTEGCTSMAMNYAAGGGHLPVVTWLYENRSEGNITQAMAYAAANGELDVVHWCLAHGGCARCAHGRVLTHPMAFNSTSERVFEARPLYPLRLLATHAESSIAVNCGGQCIPIEELGGSLNLAAVALGLGDLFLAEYLHQHHPDLFVWPDHQVESVVNTLSWEHHLPAIQWLHGRYPTSLNWLQLADVATERMQPRIAQWLVDVAWRPPSYLSAEFGERTIR